METFIDKIKRVFIYKVNNRINFTPTLIGLGVVVLVLSWIIGFMNSGAPASLSSLAELHKTSPSYFIIDLMPIILGILGFAFTKSQQETIDNLENQISGSDHCARSQRNESRRSSGGDLPIRSAKHGLSGGS